MRFGKAAELALLTTVLACALLRDASADPDPAPTATGVLGDSVYPASAASVGGSGGNVDVDEVAGAVVASVPIALPPTRGAVGPRLALHYNSNNSEGDAGMGWSLDLPRISKRTGYENWAPSDGYYLNDTPLLFVCTIGSGSCNTISPNEPPFPSWAANWNYFRPQVDSGWTRAIADPGYTTWRVQTTDGNTQEFTRSAYQTAGSWMYELAKEWDPQGGVQSPNYVFYSWAPLNGHDALTDIWYVPPYANAPTTAFEHHIHIWWDSPFPALPLNGGTRTDPTNWMNTTRISRIDIATMYGGGEGGPGGGGQRRLVRTYDMTYQPNPGGPYERIPQYRSLLQEVRMSDGCQQPESNNQLVTFQLNRQCATLPPIAMTYALEQISGSWISLGSLANIYSTPHVTVADFDSDGLADLVQPYTSPETVWLNRFVDPRATTPTHAMQQSYVTVQSQNGPGGDLFLNDQPGAVNAVGDWLGDGRTNVVWSTNVLFQPCNNPTYVFTSTSSGWTGSLTSAFGCWPTIVGDTNRDGLLDGFSAALQHGCSVCDWYMNFSVTQSARKLNGTIVPFDVSGGIDALNLTTPSVMRPISYVTTTGDLTRGEVAAGWWPDMGAGFPNGFKVHLVGGTTIGTTFVTTCTNVDDPCWAKVRVSFHDINGDGFTDIVMGEPSGNTYKIQYALFPDFSVVGPMSTPINSSTPQILLLADMDGSGTDDLLVTDMHQAWYLGFGSGIVKPRPGSLITYSNGLGARTTVSYTRTSHLGQAENWTNKLPTAGQVAQKLLIERNTLSGWQTEMERDFRYWEPVWDGWRRRLRGFQRVREVDSWTSAPTHHTGHESTYSIRDFCNQQPCQPSDYEDDPLRVMPPRLSTREVFSDGGGYDPLTQEPVSPIPSSLSVWTYSIQTAFSVPDQRHVRAVYPTVIETYLYDTSAFVPSTTQKVVTDIDGVSYTTRNQDWFIVNDGPGMQITKTITIKGTQNTEHIRTRYSYDQFGNVIVSTDDGRLGDMPNEATDLPIWRWYYVQPPPTETLRFGVWLDFTDGFPLQPGVPTPQPRQLIYWHDQWNNITDTLLWLDNGVPLLRPMAPQPPSASSNATWIWIDHSSYDAYGNVTQSFGPQGGPTGMRCANMMYDWQFNQYPVLVTTFKSGCNSSDQLSASSEYDRGFGTVTASRNASMARTEVEYDTLGRPWKIHSPEPGTPGMAMAVPSVVYDYHINLDGPIQVVHTVPAVGPQSYSYVDGFGRELAQLEQANPSDPGPWIARTIKDPQSNDHSEQVYHPYFYSGQPLSFPVGTGSTATRRIELDNFGRPLESYDYDQTRMNRAIRHALSTDFWDAEDLGGQHANTPSTLKYDGHGRLETSVVRGGGDEISTKYTYQATGEPVVISQTHTLGSPGVSRWIQYDTAGRMVLNVQPDIGNYVDPTSGPFNGTAWRYAYDDAGNLVGTSDARGCGENMFYDALGRILAEDYAPCTTMQKPYTAPAGNPLNGDGTEVFYKYDYPESGQPIVDPSFQLGRLSARYDQGSYTQFEYDSHGNVHGARKRIAYPGTPSPFLAGRYTQHIFERYATFDPQSDNLLTSTTGADAPGVMNGGMSVVSFAYTQRNQLATIGSNYTNLLSNGNVISDSAYSEIGLPTSVAYGDFAATNTSFTYNNRDFVDTVSTWRSPPSLWTNAQGSYTPPQITPYTTETNLLNVQFLYDRVGNTFSITDNRVPALWPSGAKPINRTATYDDLYRLTRTDYATSDTQISPFQAEDQSLDPRPIPRTVTSNRVGYQTFDYDWLGNLKTSDDDQHLRWDRSLGTGSLSGQHPHQLTDAGAGVIHVDYDVAGNLTSIVLQRSGQCAPLNDCSQRLIYDWDELGRLERARRWDFQGSPTYPQIPSGPPAFDIVFSYAADGRVFKEVTDTAGTKTYTVDVFDSLRLVDAMWSGMDYQADDRTEQVLLGGIARVLFADELPTVSGSRQHVFFELADENGQVGIIVDGETGELVERRTLQAFGVEETDFRPERWRSYRANARITGKYDDLEVGIVDFGPRFYQPQLGRWMSPDPLTIHGLGADSNPYGYVNGSPYVHADPSGLDGCDVPSACTPAGQNLIGVELGFGSPTDPNASKNGGGGGGGAYVAPRVPPQPPGVPRALRYVLASIAPFLGRAAPQVTRAIAVHVGPNPKLTVHFADAPDLSVARLKAILSNFRDVWNAQLTDDPRKTVPKYPQSYRGKDGAFHPAPGPLTFGDVVTAGAAVATAGRALAAEEALGAVDGTAIIADEKFGYMFGDASGRMHNIERARQNAGQFARIGVYNNPQGRALIQSHFNAITGDYSNILGSFSNQYGMFQVRESLFAGPGGFVKIQSTWQVIGIGRYRFTTAIPFGGP